MKSLKTNLIVALGFTLTAGVLWAVEPYVDVLVGDSDEMGWAREELAVESEARFGHRFVVGMQWGAGLSLIWVVYDLAKERKRPKAAARM